VLAAVLALSQISAVDANIRFGLGKSRFNSFSRHVFRGGETTVESPETSIATLVSSTKAAVPKVPTTSTSASASTPKTVVKKRRRKKSSSSISSQAAIAKATIPQAPVPVTPKVPPAPTPKVVDEVPKVPQSPVPAKETTPIEPLMPPPVEEITPEPEPIIKKEKSRFNVMPTLFVKEEEKQYDTYAACLAATESLRRIRDGKIKNKKGGTAVAGEDNSWQSMLKPSDAGSDPKNVNVSKEEYKRACAEYVLNSSKAIKALGLSVTQFNQLGREVSKNTDLKEKVMEQAYLYRMASTVKMDKVPLIQDPDSSQLLKSSRRRRVQMFVKSITEIEDLREEQTKKLEKSLNIDKLPSDVNLCDPNVLPLLSPEVKQVIKAFPLEAEKIVKKYGLNSDEFNQMLEETRGNPVFRWRVQNYRNKESKGD
jgi:hypothetical protein